MKKVFVFCIGGTGIRVMKSVTMLMASGMSTNGYTVVPVILDPHLDLEEKKNLHSLIESYEEIYRHSVNNGTSTLNALDGFFNSQMLTIGELNEQLNDTQQAAGNKEKFRSYINVANLGANDINNFFVQSLFSSKNLNNPLSVGFKGNPNVGTVILYVFSTRKRSEIVWVRIIVVAVGGENRTLFVGVVEMPGAVSRRVLVKGNHQVVCAVV